MSRARLAGIGLVLAILAAVLYWLLPAYVLPPMDLNRQPAERHDPVLAPPPVTSYVSIPLVLSVEKIRTLVREQLSGNILKDSIEVPERKLKVSIKRNGAMALWVHDSDLYLVLPIEFSVRGDLKTRGELTLFTRASFNISPDWQPDVDTRSTFRWDWQPRVGVWPFRFRIGDILAPHIQLALDKGSEEFRARAAGLYNIRGMAQTGWDRLHGPHPLDAEQQAWLQIQPREMYLEPITSDSESVYLNLWMAGELAIIESGKPLSTEALPLPHLRHGEPPAKAIVLSAPLTVSYARMLVSLREALIGQPVESASGRLVISDLDLFSAGADVGLGLVLEGTRAGSLLPVRGRIHLTGTPIYDAEARTLSIRGLKTTPASINPLTYGARWALREAPAWSAGIEPRLTWDVTELIEAHQKRLGQYMNRTVAGRFDLWGSIDELAVSGALTHDKGILLPAQARGDLQLLFMP